MVEGEEAEEVARKAGKGDKQLRRNPDVSWIKRPPDPGRQWSSRCLCWQQKGCRPCSHAPCRQGATATESGKIFSRWLYNGLCSAISLSPEINGLNCSGRNNVPTYYKDILKRLSNRQVELIEMHLRMQFNTGGPSNCNLP